MPAKCPHAVRNWWLTLKIHVRRTVWTVKVRCVCVCVASTRVKHQHVVSHRALLGISPAIVSVLCSVVHMGIAHPPPRTETVRQTDLVGEKKKQQVGISASETKGKGKMKQGLQAPCHFVLQVSSILSTFD